ncbi:MULTISPECIES: hypothetical protein [Sulfolobaceae]|uniref:hypothetical protein n=1 Tax=Sulfolobaceae TaxID=118883 RepID=UPI0008460750|nr:MULTISPECIES: hypothetical protein [unclassified Sulfolobus]
MVEEKATSRILGWNVLTGIGYSFILTIIMGVLALIVKAFYPPTVIQISPIASLIISPALGIIQLIVLALFIAFVSPLRSKVAESNLRQVRKIGIYTSLGYLAFSLLPFAFVVPYIQTYIGLIIAFNVLNGSFGGALATFF